MSKDEKPLDFVGSSRRDLRAFPEEARHEAGKELRRVQRGMMPTDWKPLGEVGPGASELRVRTAEGGVVQYRVVYLAKFPEAVYVLHAFEKKTQQTPQYQLDLAAARYKQLLRERNDRKK
jgi:phage-related protein